MLDTYTRLLEVAAESENQKVRDDAVAKLILHLKSMGRVKMLGDIAKELRKIAARRKALISVVEVADEREAGMALRAAKEAGIKASKARVNPSLIRGFRARGAGLLFDRSGKRALTDIYQQIIT
jgi:hypothetical protein